MNLDLHIFTNSTVNAPSTEIIYQTYESFLRIFKKDLSPTVWCDPKPNIDAAFHYITDLKKNFPVVRLSQSLSDGYIKAIRKSEADYLFMLEHDWEFLSSITHSLDEIISHMHEYDLWHLRFNKRKNTPVRSDKWLEEKGDDDFKYCVTPSVSNNPHIIDRVKYQEIALPLIKKAKGSKGIEHNLLNIEGMTAAIYGPQDYPMTIRHLNGRKSHV